MVWNFYHLDEKTDVLYKSSDSSSLLLRIFLLRQ